jgi:hypothetical protein
MLVIADGIARGAFALEAQDGTILLAHIDEDARHVHRLAQGSRIHHPHFGEMTVVPITICVSKPDDLEAAYASTT